MKGALSCRYGLAEIVAALLFIGMAVFLLQEVLAMPMGTLQAPGPAVFPLGILLILLLGSIVLLVQAIRRIHQAAAREVIELGNWQIWVTLLVLAVVSYVFEPLGFRIAIFILLAALLRAYSSLSTVRVLLAAMLGSIVAWGFFVKLLGVQLPVGIL